MSEEHPVTLRPEDVSVAGLLESTEPKRDDEIFASDIVPGAKQAALQAVQESANILSFREREVDQDRKYFERDITRATEYATHKEIADAIKQTGREITRQRVSQIASDD